IAVRIDAVVRQHLAQVPVAARAAAQRPQALAAQRRPAGDPLGGDEILRGGAANAAADDLEARATRERGQPRRRSELADAEAPAIELGGDFRPAEHDPEREVDSLTAEESVLDSEPELETAAVGRNAVFDGRAHRAPLYHRIARAQTHPAAMLPPTATGNIGRIAAAFRPNAPIKGTGRFRAVGRAHRPSMTKITDLAGCQANIPAAAEPIEN